MRTLTLSLIILAFPTLFYYIAPMKLLFILSTLLIVAQSFANKTTKEVLLDNEKVFMVRLTYPVGSESGFHGHDYDNRVVYVLKGGKLGIETKDRKLKKLDIKEGSALYLQKETHNIKNLGKSKIVLLETELK